MHPVNKTHPFTTTEESAMKNITIFGQGNMGKAISDLFQQAGHHTTFVKRGETAAMLGDIVVLAVPFAAVDDIIGSHAAQLAGKIVIDITNPVDFATMDGLVVPADNSAAAHIAAKLPHSHVIKAFNTNFAANLVSRKVADSAPVTVLLAGDSDEAKQTVITALHGSGVSGKDAGSLKRARELEALGFLAITLAIREQIDWTGGFALY